MKQEISKAVNNGEVGVSNEIVLSHFKRYFFSLQHFEEYYSRIIFKDDIILPKHFAYLCPLCTENFFIVFEDNLLFWSSQFSLDHFPPKSVGGSQTLLVCKECNNEAGALYESELKMKIQNMAFKNGVKGSFMNSKSNITDVEGRYPSKMIIDEEGKIQIVLKPVEKIHAPYLDKFIEEKTQNLNWKIELTPKVADGRKVAKSLVKSAYLNCFEIWGYDFVFSYTGSMLRKYLDDQCDYPALIPSFWLGKLVKDNKDFQLPLGLCYLKEPIEWKSFIVNILLIDKEARFSEIVSVIIPGPNKENWEDLERIQRLLDKEPENIMTIAHVRENTLDSKCLNGYKRSWDILVS